MTDSTLLCSAPWPVQSRIMTLQSRWVTVIAEHLQDPTGQLLEYWRVEKADSAIVLPLQDNQIWLPAPCYRPGLGQTTLDLPGGRIPPDRPLLDVASIILQRELELPAAAIAQITPVNATGWPVNSSFSNQQLYGFVAHLHQPPSLDNQSGITAYPATMHGIRQLLQELTCLQCRAVLLEWWWQQMT